MNEPKVHVHTPGATSHFDTSRNAHERSYLVQRTCMVLIYIMSWLGGGYGIYPTRGRSPRAITPET